MKTIDFKKFNMFTDISQSAVVVIDVTTQVADLIYKNANTAMAHDVAMRIYKSEGPVSFSDDEFNFLCDFITKGFTLIFQDSFNKAIKEES